jgi:hypothetical protein
MKYIERKIGNKEYKLRLGANESLEAEKALGKPLISVVAGFPSIKDALIILHQSMQRFQANIKLKDVYEIFDEYVEDGGSLIELTGIMVDVLKVSGIFAEDGEPNEEGKK